MHTTEQMCQLHQSVLLSLTQKFNTITSSYVKLLIRKGKLLTLTELTKQTHISSLTANAWPPS